MTISQSVTEVEPAAAFAAKLVLDVQELGRLHLSQQSRLGSILGLL